MNALLRLGMAAALAYAAIAAPAWAATTRLDLNDLRSYSVEYIRQDATAAYGPDDGRHALIEGEAYVRSLFESASFQRLTRAWLAERRNTPPDQVRQQWVQHFALTQAVGLRHLTDDEVDFLSVVFIQPMMQASAGCKSLFKPGEKPSMETMRLPSLAPGDTKRLYAILGRTYLAAVDNVALPPLPDAQVVQVAVLEAMSRLSAEERQRAIALQSGAVAGDPAAGCELTVLLHKGLAGVAPDSRRTFMRQYLISSFEATADPSRLQPQASEVKGLASGNFEPGNATLAYPREAAAEGIVGSMKLEISVEADGRASRVKVVERQFNKPFATTPSGEKLSLAEMFDPVVTTFFKAGRFKIKFENGKAVPYKVTLPLGWTLQ